MTSIAVVQARATELQGFIDSITPGRVAQTQNTTTDSASAATFSSVLQQALASGTGTTGSQVAADGSLLVGGLSLSDFAKAQVTPGSGMDALQRAMNYIGVPYVWGGSDPSGFDCSGLVQYVMKQMGVSLPRVAADQATVGTEVPSLDQAQPGDLIVTNGGGHIGIYVGGGQMLHAPQPGESVKISDIPGEIYTIRRVVPSGAVLNSSTGASTASGLSTDAALGRAVLQALVSSSQSNSTGSATGYASLLGGSQALNAQSLLTLASSL